MKPTREQMLSELKSIATPFIADIDFASMDGITCKVLTSTTGYIGGWLHMDIHGPFSMTLEEFKEANHILSMGYKNSSDFANDDSLSDDEQERIEDIFYDNDLDLVILLIKHKCKPEKEYHFCIFDYPNYIFFGEDRESTETYLKVKTIMDSFAYPASNCESPTSCWDLLVSCWDDMPNDILTEWHSLLSDPKLTNWENIDNEIQAWTLLESIEDPMIKDIENAAEDMRSTQGISKKKTMDDITNFADKMIIENNVIGIEDITNAFIRGKLAKSIGTQPEIVEEFDIVVNKNSEMLIYDVLPIEKLIIDYSRREWKTFVWTVSVQSLNEELNSPYDILAVADEQDMALDICQVEIASLFISYPIQADELEIHVKKAYNELGDMRYCMTNEFYIEQLQVIYRVCSQSTLWQDSSSPEPKDH